MEKLKKLNELNKFPIFSIKDENFREFGRVIENYDFSKLESVIDKETQIPEVGNCYTASFEPAEKLSIFHDVKKGIYGGMEIQIGFCNGNNSKLNGLEYHKGSEINVAVTDLVLLLGHINHIKNGEFNSENVKAFYLKKGEVVEIYQSTMHFAPCKLNDEGFKCVVILPRETNTDIELTEKKNVTDEDRYLFKRNKWLLVHGDKQDLIEKGAYKGITGENLEVRYN